MAYQRIDAPNNDAQEEFEVTAVHFGADPLFPDQAEDWQLSRPEPLGYLGQALNNLYGRRWRGRLRTSN